MDLLCWAVTMPIRLRIPGLRKLDTSEPCVQSYFWASKRQRHKVVISQGHLTKSAHGVIALCDYAILRNSCIQCKSYSSTLTLQKPYFYYSAAVDPYPPLTSCLDLPIFCVWHPRTNSTRAQGGRIRLKVLVKNRPDEWFSLIPFLHCAHSHYAASRLLRPGQYGQSAPRWTVLKSIITLRSLQAATQQPQPTHAPHTRNSTEFGVLFANFFERVEAAACSRCSRCR